MPSKKYNGNSPLQGARLGSFADAELEIAKRSPKQSLTTGVIQTPSGAIHTPKRRRRSRAGAASFDHPWKVKDVSTTSELGTFEPRVTIAKHILTDYSTNPPVPPYGFSEIGFDLADLEGENAYAIVNSNSNISFQNCDEYDAGELDFGGKSVYPIAKIFLYDDSMIIRQYVYTYLGLFDGCINGIDGQIIATI